MLRITLNKINRTSQEWGSVRTDRTPSLLGTVQAYAKANGYAGVWFTDGRFTLYYMDGGKLRQRSWPMACLA